ncbi:hypothetical protein [Simkania sp.]|uniref:hypothetical protein n=1 Tax=Simkania sp. TaxID=34094 RepID=UPI003B52D07F
MAYKGRALYNLLQMNLKRNPQLEVEAWQVEDYRNLSLEELFSRLENFQIFLDEDHFVLYIEESDSPEDLTDVLYLEKDFATHEQIFLCLFEIWRRLSPHKQSLSLFCDEIDHLIEEYEDGELEHEEDLQAALVSLQKILDDNVDEGGDAEEGFEMLSRFSCHDLEVFIYEYVAHQLDVENDLYASELLEGFYPYIQNKRWFDFLRIRVMAAADVDEANIMAARLLETLREDNDIHLLFELMHFLVFIGENEQFMTSFNMAVENLETEDDLRELLNVIQDYFDYLDKEKEEKVVRQILEDRQSKDPSHPIDPDDEIFLHLKHMLTLSPA